MTYKYNNVYIKCRGGKTYEYIDTRYYLDIICHDNDI